MFPLSMFQLTGEAGAKADTFPLYCENWEAWKAGAVIALMPAKGENSQELWGTLR